jgi:S-adenosylmethionine:tRNA-ribosyltransferase-isomerase (queuine synthetase)
MRTCNRLAVLLDFDKDYFVYQDTKILPMLCKSNCFSSRKIEQKIRKDCEKNNTILILKSENEWAKKHMFKMTEKAKSVTGMDKQKEIKRMTYKL